MLALWFFLLGLPCVLLGGAALWFTDLAQRQLIAFPRNRAVGCVLCAIGWLGTAYEVDTIGIEVFDRVVRRFWFLQSDIPGSVWILAIVLTVLTCLWMANLLPIRGLAAICMLFPAELFPAIRLCDTSWRLMLVVTAYLAAPFGMFAMFYPWRVRQFWAYLAQRPGYVRGFGMAFAGWGMMLLILGVLAAAGKIA